MPLSRTSVASGRSRSRSPAQPPLPVLQSPRQFLPPSHYAEAGGLTAFEKSKHNKDNSEQGTPRSNYIPYLSPHSTASNDAIEFQSNSPQSNSRSSESRQRRESQILNLPLVESQLLPSLRDTIDRMTRPPLRPHSKAGPTTPTFKISSGFDSVWPVATSRPHTPQCHSTLKHTPEESLSVSEPSTPKATNPPTSKSVLKSALRSPNLRGKPEHTEVITSPSGSGVTLRSVKSLLRRKSSALATIESPTKVEFKENKPPETFSVIRAPSRSRSRTDPGSRPPTIKGSEDVPIPLPTTPQPTSSYESRSFTSNIPRLRGNYSGGSRAASADDSDLEYRLELEARQHRRLTVINAKIPSYTSSSESELESIVLSPATDLDEQMTTGEGMVGLGFDFMDLNQNRDVEVQTATKHFSMNTYASAGSIYTDEETEESILDTGIYPTRQSSQSMDSLDTKHNRRRETLLGLVRGLDRYYTPQQPIMSGDESEYNGEPGLAISSSGDVQTTSVNTGVQEDRITLGDELESEYEQEGLENEANFEGPCHRLSRNPTHTLSFGRRQGQRSPLPFKPSNSPKTESESKRPNKSSRLIDSNNLKATATSVSNRKSFRYEHSSRSQPNPSSPRNLAPQPQPVVRDSFNSYESVVIAKKSREAAARGREAFGIPPSESDEVYHTSPIPNKHQIGRQTNVALPHVDSVVSNIDGEIWDNDKDNGQLSMGAEALFREIGADGGGGRWDAKGKVNKGKRPSSTDLKSDEVEAHRNLTGRTRSRTVSPSRGDHSQTREGNSINNHSHREIPSRGSWRSTISSSTYSSLLRQHGELEMKRQEIIWELYRSELDFVEKLGSVVKFFILPLRVQNSKTWISGVPLEITKIFDWLEDIVTLHTQIRDTLTSIQAAKRPIVDLVAESLHGLVHKLEIYQPYLVKIEDVSAMLQRLLNDSTSDFGEFVTIQEKEIGDERRLINLLQVPVKRLELYPNIFKQLLEATPKVHNDYFSTLILVHSTNVIIKALTEVKAREDEYAYIKDLSERIGGLPHKIGIPHRERRLLCQGRLNLVQSSTCHFSSTLERPSSRVLPSSPDSGYTRTSRLASAIQEWNAERARFGSKASIDTTSTYTDVPKSPLSEQFSSRDRPLHLQDRYTHKSTPLSASTSIQAFLFSDLLVLTQPITRRPSSKTRERHDYGRERWNLLKDIGLSRVLDVLEPGSSDEPDSVTLEVLLIGNTDSSQPHVRTVCLDFPEGSELDTSTRQAWIRNLRQSSRFSIIAMSDPDRGERYVKALNDTLDKDLSRILDTITASGLPVPKSPSMQLDGVESDLVRLEREERGWWSMRFQQVLKENQFEERYSQRMNG